MISLLASVSASYVPLLWSYPCFQSGESRCGLMKNPLGLIKTFANPIVQKARVCRWVLVVLAVIFLLQFYFVRELLAAGLFFALGFAVVLALGGPAYLIGSAGVSWLEHPRRSQSNATPSLEKSGAFDERALTPRSSWRVQGKGENSEPSKPSMSLEDAVSKRKGSVPHATSI